MFRRDPARRGTGWCGDCPKCRFVFLALAPWMEPERLVRIFGRNLLDEPAQEEGFGELVGLGAHKPLERCHRRSRKVEGDDRVRQGPARPLPRLCSRAPPLTGEHPPFLGGHLICDHEVDVANVVGEIGQHSHVPRGDGLAQPDRGRVAELEDHNPGR